MRRILSLFIAFAMIMTMALALPSQWAMATETASGTAGDLTWVLENGTLTISGSGAMPDDLSANSVPWYDYRSSIQKVVISNGVTNICYGAFYNCSDLTRITIPDSITSIGSAAFYGCESLVSVTIPDSVTSIGEWAFYNCSSLTDVTIPDGVTSIGSRLFYGCSSLRNIKIPNSVTNIGSFAFSGCSSLTSVTIPSGVTSIGNYAFKDCRLESIYITDIADWCNISFTIASSNPLSYGGSLYINGELAEEITIPDGIATIGDYTFAYCSNLTSITIPNSVTSIGQNAFYYCKSLTNIAVPDGVISIGSYAFHGCSSLISVTIPDGVTSIGDSTFAYCSSLTSITIPNSVTSIGKEAFYYCEGLTNITIPDSVASIGSRLFYGCGSLTNITIPDGVTMIDTYTFAYCRSLTDITIPSSVTSIGGYAFCDCSILDAIYYGGSKEEFASISVADYNEPFLSATVYYTDVSVEGVSLDKNSLTLYVGESTTLVATVLEENATNMGVLWESSDESVATVADGVVTAVSEGEAVIMVTTEDGAYTAECGVTVVVGGTFGDLTWELEDGALTISGSGAMPDYSSASSVPWYDYRSSIQKAVISNGVASIGIHAFSGCYSLTSIIIPDSVTSIGEGAFAYCSSLTSITIPANVTNIDSYAFAHCSSLMSVTLPNSVINIDSYAFGYCSSLTNIIISGSAAIPEGIASIGSWAFCYCSSLTNITILDSVTSIGEGAFCGCSNLTSVKLPASVTDIEKYAFNACLSLDSIYYGSSEDDFASINVGDYNKPFLNATVYYNYVAVAGVEIDKNSINPKVGESATLVATVLPEDATNANVTWESSDESVAMVVDGTITAISEGDAVITVTAEDGGYSAECSVTVYPANVSVESVLLDKKSITLEVGESTTLIATVLPEDATNTGVTWASSDESIATVLNGVVTAVSEGDVVITVTTEDGGYSAECSVTVYPANVSVESVLLDKESITLEVGESTTLVATVLPEDATNTGVTWASSDESIVIVMDGVITAVSAGDAVITVTTEDGGYSAECSVTVYPAEVSVKGVELDKESITLEVGESAALIATVLPEDATNTNVMWSSSDESIATVLNGVVTAVSESDAVITVTTEDGGYSAECSVTVYPANVSVEGVSLDKNSLTLFVGENTALIATVLPEDATNTGLIWISSNKSVATVTDGVVTAVSAGSAVITATTEDGGYTAVCSVNVVVGGTFGDLTWVLEDGTLTISGNGAMTDFDSYLSVPWYELRNSIEAVVIENGVTNVGSYAFWNLQMLSTVSLGESVTSIGKSAFSLCGNISEIIMPDSVKIIEESAFYGCAAMTKLVLSKEVEDINENAFYGCSNLSDVYYGGTVSDWNAISIASGNDALYNAAMILSTDEDALPTISSKDVLGGIEITIESKYDNIYYTTNGSSPSTSSTRYESSFKLSKAGSYTIKAIASNGVSYSDTAELTLILSQTSAPSLSYTDGFVVIDSDAAVYYTFSLSTPDSKDNIYSTPIEITAATYVSARAVEYGRAKSEVVSVYCEYQEEIKEYDPLSDSYSFENTITQLYGLSKVGRSYYISEETYQRVFGKTMGHSLYEETNSRWNGSCFGLSLTSALFFAGYINQSDYNSGADCVYDIQAPKSADKEISKLIERCQISQYLESFQTECNDNRVRSGKGDMSNIVSAVQNCNESPIVLYIRLYKDELLAHAVLPYAVEDNNDGTYTVFVYDPNLPATADDYGRTLTIDTNNNTFIYKNQYTYDYDISYVSISTLMEDIDSVSLFSTEENDKILFIVNSEDVSICNSAGVEADDIDGALKYCAADSSEEDGAIWLLPADNYTVYNQNGELEGLGVSVANRDDYYKMTISDSAGTAMFGYSDSKLYMKYETDSDVEITMNSYNSEMKTSTSSVVTNYLHVTSANSNSIILSTNSSTVTSNGTTYNSILTDKDESSDAAYTITVSQNAVNSVNHDCSITIKEYPTFADDKITGTFVFYLENNGEVQESGSVYIATYDEDTGNLIDIKAQCNVSVDADDSCSISVDFDITELISEHQYSTKIFFWDETQTPNCDNAKIYY